MPSCVDRRYCTVVRYHQGAVPIRVRTTSLVDKATKYYYYVRWGLPLVCLVVLVVLCYGLTCLGLISRVCELIDELACAVALVTGRSAAT